MFKACGATSSAALPVCRYPRVPCLRGFARGRTIVVCFASRPSERRSRRLRHRGRGEGRVPDLDMDEGTVPIGRAPLRVLGAEDEMEEAVAGMEGRSSAPRPSTPNASGSTASNAESTVTTTSSIEKEEIEPEVITDSYAHELNERQRTRDVAVDPEQHRRAQILMKIARAGAGVEHVIATHAEDIDEEMLAMLEARIELARHNGEEHEAEEGLVLLWQRLRAEFERQHASAELRLLDEVMRVLEPDSGAAVDEEGRITAARTHLNRAFEATAAGGTDLIDLARRLAKDASVADSLADSLVDRARFIAEAEDVLRTGQQGQAQIEESIAKLVVGDTETQDKRAQLERVYEERAAALHRVAQALTLARQA